MTVVGSDTSPIRALPHLGLMTLLQDLYDQVIVPPAVATELSRARRRIPPIDVNQFPFVAVQAPMDQDRVFRLRQSLHVGEAEAVVRALETGSSAILIDESKARRLAQSLGMRVIGVLGVLLDAKQQGLIPAVRPLIDDLQNNLWRIDNIARGTFA
jgi:predicted nucleic acid-binding protein